MKTKTKVRKVEGPFIKVLKDDPLTVQYTCPACGHAKSKHRKMSFPFCRLDRTKGRQYLHITCVDCDTDFSEEIAGKLKEK